MSTVFHQVIILPGDTDSFYCKDGLSSIDVYNIEHIFNFGNMKFVNCGAPNQFVGLKQAEGDMGYLYVHARAGSREEGDYEKAWNANKALTSSVIGTPFFQASLPESPYERMKVLWDAMYTHWCKKPYTGGYISKMLMTEKDFKEKYCPE